MVVLLDIKKKNTTETDSVLICKPKLVIFNVVDSFICFSQFIGQYFSLVGASHSEAASSVMLFEPDNNYRCPQ